MQIRLPELETLVFISIPLQDIQYKTLSRKGTKTSRAWLAAKPHDFLGWAVYVGRRIPEDDLWVF